MASETATSTTTATQQSSGNWKAGVVGGIVGAIPFGLMMALMLDDPVIAVAIPSMYGLAPPPNELAGFVVHLSHGAILGVVFAAVIGLAGLSRESAQKQVAAGLAYGIVLWVVLAVIVMPIWLSAVGSPADPPLPNVSIPSLIGHAVYGVVLGAVYYALEGI
jgi:uncharacterized membrane protein YagU involved in acid resistance